jgi:hypothetical protein
MAFKLGDFTDTNAFFWSDVSLAVYAGTDAGSTPYQILLTDAAGKTARGFIGAVGEGAVGEGTLVGDAGSVFTDWTGAVPTGWAQAGTPGENNYTEENPADQMHIVSTGAFIGIDKEAALTLNALYKNTVDISSITGTLAMGSSLITSQVYYTTTGNGKVLYVTATGTTAEMKRQGAVNATIDNWKLERVTDPPATGVHIVKTFNGTERDWASKEDGFNPNTITTVSITLSLPTVTTAATSSITNTTAAAGGNVTDIGTSAVTARGVCWRTTANPTTADSKTTDGSGAGAFTSAITGLTPAATYHLRAYATNTEGTAYGADVEFTALPSGGGSMRLGIGLGIS